MTKMNNAHDNFLVNFVLKGFTSILIGVYILLGTYLIKILLGDFLAGKKLMGFIQPQQIEDLVLTISFLVFLFSSITLLFSGRKTAEEFRFKLWNGKTKTAAITYFSLVVLLFFTLYFLNKEGFINLLTPVFLFYYGLMLIVLKSPKSSKLYALALTCMLLAILCYIIPSYWNSACSILAIGHIIYGMVVRN
jgi:hypothetical protein